eukprot:GFYU01004422.1.p1 GENE.GFYU01004422.1~~GFYU01004422.1.p1  ORF type:complete len:432 (-),score=88.46 GFYU01004422.1:45-1340(-)
MASVRFNLLIALVVSLAAVTSANYKFSTTLLDSDLPNSYSIFSKDLNNDGYPDIVAVSLDGLVVCYENPGYAAYGEGSNAELQRTAALTDVDMSLVGVGEWKKRTISTLKETVFVDFSDVDNDGFQDIAVIHDFGKCPDHCTKDDGAISWLRNPEGDLVKGEWKSFLVAHPIPGIHRLRFADMNGDGVNDIVSVPVVGAYANADDRYLNSAAVIEWMEAPKDVFKAASWSRHPLLNTLHAVHDVRISHGVFSDMGVLASFEGLTAFRPASDGSIDVENLSRGDTSKAEKFRGCSSVEYGYTNQTAFLATVEPFHGDTVSIYRRRHNGADGLKRHQLTIRAQGGHDLQVADINRDGMDDVLTGFRGPEKPGLVLFECADPEAEHWNEHVISDVGVSLLTVADFDLDGKLDLASIGWGSIGNPVVHLHMNESH